MAELPAKKTVVPKGVPQAAPAAPNPDEVMAIRLTRVECKAILGAFSDVESEWNGYAQDSTEHRLMQRLTAHVQPPDVVKANSSNVDAFGYDPAVETLIVHFKGGGRYAYYDVPVMIASAMKEAESVGKYLNEHIKPHYKCEKLG